MTARNSQPATRNYSPSLITTAAAAATVSASSSSDEAPCSSPKRRRSGLYGERLLIGMGDSARMTRMRMSASACSEASTMAMNSTTSSGERPRRPFRRDDHAADGGHLRRAAFLDGDLLAAFRSYING